VKFTNLKAISLLLPISLLLLSFTAFVRFFSFKGILPGYDPYFHILYNYSNPFGIISNYVSPLFLSPFFAFMSVLIFYWLLLRLGFDIKFSLLSSLIFTVSPSMLYLAAFPCPYSMLLFLLLASILLLSFNNFFSNSLSMVLLIASSFFGVVETFVVISCAVSFMFYKNKLAGYVLPAATLMIIVSLIKSFTFPSIYHFESFSLLITDIISDLGSLLGFGAFAILLCGIGIYLAGSFKIKVYSAYVCFFILMIFSLFFARWVFIFANVFVSVFAAFAFFSLMKRKYKIDLIRTLTLFAVVCGLMFSSISYVHRASFMGPTADMVDSLEWLGKNSEKDDIMLSHYSNGFWIDYFSGRKSFSDSNNMMSSVSDDIFNGRNLKSTEDILSSNKIKYIIITSEMKKGQVWDVDDDGLMFLMHRSNSFEMVHSSGGIEIWKFLGGKDAYPS
jgi:hypothetical protein